MVRNTVRTFNIVNLYTKKIEKVFRTEKEANIFINKTAAKLNYGLLRHWKDENNENVYDCGPVIYVIREIHRGIKNVEQ